jgi:hypothetical protein
MWCGIINKRYNEYDGIIALSILWEDSYSWNLWQLVVIMVEYELSRNRWTLKGYKERVTTKHLKSLLTQGSDSVIINGRLCDLKKKSLGAGMYDIWFKERKYE